MSTYSYEVAKGHGLPHNPFKAIVAPRPIGWISTRSPEGVLNLAPYSFFNAVCDTPPIVMFSSSGYKDSVTNVDASGEFVFNLASEDLKDAMNVSSAPYPHGVSEFEKAGLTPAASTLIGTPRVAEAKAAFECRHLQTLRLAGLDGQPADSWVVFGEVVAVHIDESVLVDGLFDVTRARPLARLGYMDYSVVDAVFQMKRPSA
ncbi:flavin reductase family protein [Stappia sp.]|uniref:flavin reductase family protein n=1 Tax=Stappia sp. TaxID=1870903 RepID=UPI003A9A5192